MRSRSATDVPPNFITSRAMTFPGAPKGANKRPARKPRAPARKGAYTYRRVRRAATTADAEITRSPTWLPEGPHDQCRLHRGRAFFAPCRRLVESARAYGGLA